MIKLIALNKCNIDIFFFQKKTPVVIFKHELRNSKQIKQQIPH